MAVYGYARCSTDETKQDLNRQVKELKQMGCSVSTIYKEYESGTKETKAELEKLLSVIGPGDSLVTLEISRITRSVKQLCEFMEFAQERKIKLIAGGLCVDFTSGEPDPFSAGVIKILGVVAEMERNMIRARVKSGLRSAWDEGRIGGQPKKTVESIPASFKRYYEQYERKEINLSELSRLSGVARSTAYRYIRLLGSVYAQ